MSDPMSDTTVVGVLLAAGRGMRFDYGNKLCYEIDGEPIVRRAASTLLAAPVDDAVVVLGHEADDVRRSLAPLSDRVEFVRNPAYEEGQSTSVEHGAKAAREHRPDAIVFALGDMPAVDQTTYQRLLDGFESSDRPIAVPTYDGSRGNPVVFGASVIDNLAHVEGDVGGRVLFDQFPVERISVDDPGVLSDIDTVEDLDAHSATDDQ